MVIYGVAIVAFCFFLGNFTGDVLGRIAGLNSNIGGVGFAMLFLLIAAEYGRPFLERNLNSRHICNYRWSLTLQIL